MVKLLVPGWLSSVSVVNTSSSSPIQPAVSIIDTVHMFCAAHSTYWYLLSLYIRITDCLTSIRYTVTNYTNPDALTRIPWYVHPALRPLPIVLKYFLRSTMAGLEQQRNIFIAY